MQKLRFKRPHSSHFEFLGIFEHLGVCVFGGNRIQNLKAVCFVCTVLFLGLSRTNQVKQMSRTL